MSWVDIQKGNEKFNVPYQAFKDLYEKHGFELINPTQPLPKQEKVEKEPKEKVNDARKSHSNRKPKI